MIALVLAMAASAPACADTIPVKSAELRIEEGEVLINAEFDLGFNSTLEEALQNGIPFYFVLEFELTRATPPTPAPAAAPPAVSGPKPTTSACLVRRTS